MPARKVDARLIGRRVLHSGQRVTLIPVLGFFSFTEITDPGAHEAYNHWHVFDHQPEQFTIDGINFGERWVRSPRCRAAEVPAQPPLEPFHYMTLYLLRDESVIQPFFDLAKDLHAQDRFFRQRKALLSGPFEIEGRWAAPRVLVSPEALPFRPSQRALHRGRSVPSRQPRSSSATGWPACGNSAPTVATSPWPSWTGTCGSVADDLGALCSSLWGSVEWAGPLEPVDASGWDWFATLTA